MIKYLIIDDEHIAHDIIKGYCDMLPNLEFKADCYDAIEAIDYLSKHTVDLIFLDLNMPKLKGFEFLKTLSSPPKVIVTTAYSEFAIEGYELNIVDYLLKPFSFERFLSAVNKVTNSSNTSNKDESKIKLNPEGRHVFLKQNNSHIQVDIDSILFIEASGNYTKIITNDNTISIREKISDTIALLSDTDFLQVHKSFAVAKKHIHRIEGNRIYMGDHIVPIGKLYKANVNRLLK
ncbi:LytR/AlgR family response regulator transcription factor [Winogradskyella immobilis]|uniref:Response regulator transcription factor n=1 Tax=Winogradskyella immobilis TaxID=2816852 RepID=A0ABS8EN43_9FLAO|nr:LytTR family DNA-binding domain-containing protein [Winogradskyella immobilis]MCC1484643.1 response regulator transcription factor [Winogradskyella immobilis]MCG0016735.1 LytTR family DNA-binding domain-containing protein [Winogradskyella immobilis]